MPPPRHEVAQPPPLAPFLPPANNHQRLRQSTSQWKFVAPQVSPRGRGAPHVTSMMNNNSHNTRDTGQRCFLYPEALPSGDAARMQERSVDVPDPSMEPSVSKPLRMPPGSASQHSLRASCPTSQRTVPIHRPMSPRSSTTTRPMRDNNCLLLDDYAVLADAAHPIASLPFLSTRDAGETVASTSYSDGDAPMSPASPTTRSGNWGDERQLVPAGQASSSPTKRRDLRSVNVSPTRRTAKVIFLDEGIGGLLYDEAGVFVAKFDMDDFVLHSTTTLHICDLLTYNRVREGQDTFRAVRLVRQRSLDEEERSGRGLVGLVPGDEGLSDFVCRPFDPFQSGCPRAIEGRRDDRRSQPLRASLVGLEYRAFLARGSHDLTASNNSVNMDASSMASLRRVLNPLIASHQHKGLGKRLMQMSREHPEWLLQQVEQEFDADALAALGNAAQRHGKATSDPVSIFQLHETRATSGAITEFLSRGEVQASQMEKRRHEQNRFQWWMPKPDALGHFYSESDDAATPQGEEEASNDPTTSLDFDDAAQSSRHHDDRGVLVGQHYEQERKRIATVNVRTFVDGVDLEAPSPSAIPSWARRRQPQKSPGPPQGHSAAVVPPDGSQVHGAQRPSSTHRAWR